MSELPAEVESWIGTRRYEEDGEFEVERGYVLTSCASVENGNPLFWDEKLARDVTGGWIAPPSMLSVWFRPHFWAPGRAAPRQPLQVHFDLKERLGLPEAVMTDNEIVFGEPVRPGDRLRTWQVLRSVSEPKRTKLGSGRFWVIDVEYVNQRGEFVGRESYTGLGYGAKGEGGDAGAGRPTGAEAARAASATQAGPGTDAPAAPPTASAAAPGAGLDAGRVRVGDRLPPLAVDVTATTVILGALASRDWRPMHHDRDFAQKRNRVRDIFLNTPNQAAWFERFLTDWTGPLGRLGRLRFRMKDSVFPGDRMRFAGEVEKLEADAAGCVFADLALTLHASERLATESRARIAIPARPGDNPWRRRGEEWRP
jgi:acyl dehydratase